MQRLHQNHGAYHGERIEIESTLRAIETAGHRHGWKTEPFLATAEFRWLALHRPAAVTGPVLRVYLSAGIHGDEPAAPSAILRLLESNCWPSPLELTVLPCLNPFGFANNRRENADGIDLNRDYLAPKSTEIKAHLAWLERQAPFDLCLCLHEDWEAHGFYVYELNPDGQSSLAQRMVDAVAKVCPIDRSELIEGRAAEGGIIRPNLDPQQRPLWPESFWLLQNRTRLSYTLEAPSDFPLTTRTSALVTAVSATLEAFVADRMGSVTSVPPRAASSIPCPGR